VTTRGWLAAGSVVVACGHAGPPHAPPSTRPVPVQPGQYAVEKSLPSEQTVTTHAVTLELTADGAAHLRLDDAFVVFEGDLLRDDHEQVEMAGRWVARGDLVTIDLAVTRACLDGFGEPDCAHTPSRRLDDWHLRCRAVAPLPGSPLPGPALLCRATNLELEARYTVTVDGARVLVLGGPGAAIRYSTRL
jgi:hypothetical protein